MTIMPVEINDKFDVHKDRVFISGTQALVRLCLMRSELDRQAGLSTAGYVSGYRGSPLGGLDQQFPRAADFLKKANVVFEPALNEDLAATALWGTQQAEMRGEGAFDGVFGMWYGKGPGVDRSGDVFRHANFAGTSPHGGVLVLMGDDHTCESSTTCHQSEYALMDAMIPVLSPANAQEIIDYGLHGWALSRFAGVWCGLKCVKDNVESTASIEAGLDRFESHTPVMDDLPPDGLNIRTNDMPQVQEVRMHRHKHRAVQAYARVNQLDKVIFSGGRKPRVGIVSTGKSYMDTLQALTTLGIDEARADELGLSLYKVAMPWPLEPEGIGEFCTDLDLVIVVEEKRGLIEGQLKQFLYGVANAPAIVGKQDEAGNTLFQVEAALNPLQIAEAIGSRVADRLQDAELRAATQAVVDVLNADRTELEIQRKPYFCAGCPHNTSTVIPENSRGFAGIGCHWMVQLMDRGVEGYTHMGGEGANWIGESRFSTRKHAFQQIGDGTFNHSGIMAIRAAVATNTNITFKLLYNDAVAMTGGQLNDGGIDVYGMMDEIAAMHVAKMVVVTDAPENYTSARLPKGVAVEHRDQLMSVQEGLAKIDGVTVLVYEQTCASEKRRRRKRGIMEDPDRRVFINEAVCEGCGDCGVQSNCVAVLPLETEFGRKRKIDQSACNKDYSCVNGFCPSFVTIEGGQLKKPASVAGAVPAVPEPANQRDLSSPCSIVLTGVGGTGVVTIGALLGMAAHLEGKGCGIIDMAGLAQKGGAVVSHIKLAKTPAEISAIRIAPGGADLMLGCDLLVSASEVALKTLDPASGHVVANLNQKMPGEFAVDPDLKMPVNLMQRRLSSAVPEDASVFVDATHWATALLGNSIAANMFMLGVAYQHGLIPVSIESIYRAIELNGVDVPFNQQALEWGRVWVHDSDLVTKQFEQPVLEKKEKSLAEKIAYRAQWLTDFQSKAYAKKYTSLMEKVEASDNNPEKLLSHAVAHNAFKLMAYKDEYEVARLYTNGSFDQALGQQFDGDYRVQVYLAPPLLSKPDPQTGKARKRVFGPWVFTLFRILAPMKKLRGTPFDLFGYTEERKTERALVQEYFSMLDDVISSMNINDYQRAVELAQLPASIRGFGHVKQASVEKARERKRVLMKLLRESPAAIAEVA